MSANTQFTIGGLQQVRGQGSEAHEEFYDGHARMARIVSKRFGPAMGAKFFESVGASDRTAEIAVVGGEQRLIISPDTGLSPYYFGVFGSK
jgi:hypothetical protein